MSPEARAERRRRWREAVRLARTRLARTTGGRVGRVATWSLLALFAGATVAQRFGERSPVEVLGYAPSAARTSAWLAAGAFALAAANQRERIDAADGVSALVSGFGIGRTHLRLGRLVAVVSACAMAVFIPAAGTALVGTALQPTLAQAAGALAIFPALAVFAAVAGLAIGGAAAAADRAAPHRGRSALLALVMVPWLLADAVGWHGASIPGALEALLQTALAAVGRGDLA